MKYSLHILGYDGLIVLLLLKDNNINKSIKNDLYKITKDHISNIISNNICINKTMSYNIIILSELDHIAQKLKLSVEIN